MKLHYSGTSPYVRKVMACAIARGLDERIEKHNSNPHASLPDLLADNPLSRVPCLITDDGVSLYDSPVICEYLDSIGDAPKLFPAAGPLRWGALKLQAMGDGILDSAVPCRGELAKPREAARDGSIARYKAQIARTVDALEGDLPGAGLDIGTIAVACALGYLDFRYGSDPWRPGHPLLAAWYEEVARHPAIAGTVPKE